MTSWLALVGCFTIRNLFKVCQCRKNSENLGIVFESFSKSGVLLSVKLFAVILYAHFYVSIDFIVRYSFMHLAFIYINYLRVLEGNVLIINFWLMFRVCSLFSICNLKRQFWCRMESVLLSFIYVRRRFLLPYSFHYYMTRVRLRRRWK